MNMPTFLDVMRVAIPVSIPLFILIYLGVIEREIKELQSSLKARLWLEDPSQPEESQLDRDLKKYISIKETQANRTKIFAILFAGLAVIFIFITGR